jgi:purine-binding chemotaxis protein CheW
VVAADKPRVSAPNEPPTSAPGGVPGAGFDAGSHAGPNTAMLLRLGPSSYALPVEAVREIVRLPPVTRVPGLPAFVAGLTNVRGRVLAVLDLRPLLELDIPRGERLVILDGPGGQAGRAAVGLVVDAALDLFRLPAAGLEPLPPGMPAEAAHVLAGITVIGEEVGGEAIAVLSPAGLLGLRGRLPGQAAA